MHQVNSHQEECLNILQEECAEAIQSASKIKRFGLIGKRLESDLTNIGSLETELGDVLALIDMVRDSDIGITDEGLQRAKESKMGRLSQFMHTRPGGKK